MPTDLEWAYAAGLIDGEGCIRRFGKGEYGSGNAGGIRLTVAMTDFTVVEWLASTFKVGKLSLLQPRHEKAQPQRIWTVRKKSDIQFMLEGIQPYCIVKKRQVQLAKEYNSIALAHRSQLHPGRRAAWEAMEGMNQPRKDTAPAILT